MKLFFNPYVTIFWNDTVMFHFSHFHMKMFRFQVRSTLFRKNAQLEGNSWWVPTNRICLLCVCVCVFERDENMERKMFACVWMWKRDGKENSRGRKVIWMREICMCVCVCVCVCERERESLWGKKWRWRKGFGSKKFCEWVCVCGSGCVSRRERKR